MCDSDFFKCAPVYYHKTLDDSAKSERMHIGGNVTHRWGCGTVVRMWDPKFN